jgi:hypothetical protein
MVCMALKVLICSGDDELPQHWSVLRAIIHTLNSLTAKSVLAGEKLVATYSISTLE